MIARVLTAALSNKLQDRVFPVVGEFLVAGLVMYELDVTAASFGSKRKIYPFSAAEVKLIRDPGRIREEAGA